MPPVTIRALKPEDRGAMLSVVGRVGAQSLYRRFFGPNADLPKKRPISTSTLTLITHIALVTVVEEGGKDTIIGAGVAAFVV
jgi:hypothetical protein